jgi:uncharacterized membrane protein YgdD (TMEM256/DUF423 family)
MKGPYWLVLGATLAAAGVALGAYHAHGLQGWLEATGATADQVARRMHNADVAVRYQMYHALGLMIVAYLASQKEAGPARIGGWLFVVGTLIFSGSLYTLVLTDIRWLGAITPIGGTAFLAGWLALAWGVWRR